MKVSDYIKEIDRAKSVERLRELMDDIEEDTELSPGDVNVLMNIHLLPKLYKYIGGGKRLYLEDANKALKKLKPIMSEKAYKVLKKYLLTTAPVPELEYGYESLETLRRRVVKYIPGLVEYIYKEIGRPVEISDFDKKRLTRPDLEDYILETYPTDKYSPHTRYNMQTILHSFGKWLEKSYPITFPRSGFTRPKGERKPEYYLIEKRRLGYRVELKLGKGSVRTPEELERIFNAVHQLRKRRSPFLAEQLEMYFYFLFQRGLRPEQATALRVGDIINAREWMKCALGRKHLFLNYREIVRRERRRLGFSESRVKMVPELIQISEHLYRRMMKFINKYDLRDDDLIFGIKTSVAETAMKRIKELSGIKTFTRRDARVTWTSAVWNILVYGEVLISNFPRGTAQKTLLDLGGWETANVPFEHYIGTLTPVQALEIVDRYEIYLPTVVTPVIEAIRKDLQSPEIEMVKKELKLLRELLPEDMRKKFEELRKREIK